ncbi:hypothetical protein Cgig2_027152 [Carnegiea gigantea]|uniref:Uncharacterized protein n=1 Tax=Carnegiea gigantea TaxID=171969 RepID=A0A9Q1GU43_9CARY|nr:hypothetical protein Cgig2_027152 [Carnegiea gigantea]
MLSSITTYPSASNSARHSDGSLTDGEDIYMTVDTDNGTEFFAVEPPRALHKIESMQKERQISVDPISLQGSTIRQASFRLVSPPKNGSGLNPPVPSPPPKLKFVSVSLPGSAGSSPISKGKRSKASSKAKSNLSRIQSAMDDSHLAMREAESRRSKSCGEARSSNPVVDDFDLWLEKSSTDLKGGMKANNSIPQHSVSYKFSKPPLGPSRENQHQMSKSRRDDQDFPEDGFKCSVSDMQSPVTAAFVFDDDNDDSNKLIRKDKEPIGVSKGAPKMDRRKSQDSMKHGRFSTSSPTSGPFSPFKTPLDQATDDFEAFLEAQAG